MKPHPYMCYFCKHLNRQAGCCTSSTYKGTDPERALGQLKVSDRAHLCGLTELELRHYTKELNEKGLPFSEYEFEAVKGLTIAVALKLEDLEPLPDETYENLVHRVKMEFDKEYAKTFYLKTFPEGTQFSVTLQCKNREDMLKLYDACEKGTLIHGCKIVNIMNRDVVTEHYALGECLKRVISL